MSFLIRLKRTRLVIPCSQLSLFVFFRFLVLNISKVHQYKPKQNRNEFCIFRNITNVHLITVDRVLHLIVDPYLFVFTSKDQR